LARRRRRHSNQFRFNVALVAIKSPKTLNAIASENNLHPNQVSSWKKKLLEDGPTVFGSNVARQPRGQVARESQLYEQVGRLKMKLEWLKKMLPDSIEMKRAPRCRIC
jgi:putative transposase